jgi:hypothetical protein
VAAFFTATGGLVFEKFHRLITNRSGNFKNISRLPIATVLSRAFHLFLFHPFTAEIAERAEKEKSEYKNRKSRGNISNLYLFYIFYFYF